MQWYRRATLVVVPTVKLEGFGLSTAEALACGTHVVGTQFGATPELLEPLDPGLIAPGNTPRALAGTVSRLLSDPARLASIGARSRARVVPAMGWEAIARRYLEIYRRLLGEGGEHRAPGERRGGAGEPRAPGASAAQGVGAPRPGQRA